MPRLVTDGAGGRCPRCGSTLITDGRAVWCSFVGSQGHGPVREPPCTYGIHGRVLVTPATPDITGPDRSRLEA